MCLFTAALSLNDFSTFGTAAALHWKPSVLPVPQNSRAALKIDLTSVSASGLTFLKNYSKFFRKIPRLYDTSFGDMAIEFNDQGRVTLIVTDSKIIFFDERSQEVCYQEINLWASHPSQVREILEKI